MKKLGEILIEGGLIDEKQLSEALEIQKKKRDFLGSILIEQGALEEGALLKIVSEQTKYPIADIGELDKGMIKMVPWRVARQCKCLPFRDDDDGLHIAFLDISSSLQLEAIARKLDKKLKIYITGPTSIEGHWTDLYGDEKTRDTNLLRTGLDSMKSDVDEKTKTMSLLKKNYAATGDDGEVEVPLTAEEEKKSLEIKDFDAIVSGVLDNVVMDSGAKDSDYRVSMQADAPPIIKMVNGIIIKADEMEASDIHIEPFEKAFRVRFRIDGTLHEMMNLPSSIRNPVTSRIKIMSSMDIAERRIPQDGRIKLKLGTRELELRVNTLPTIYGEKVVMRLLGQSKLSDNISSLGMEPDQEKVVTRALAGTFGMVLVTGPTGSGKSTTLYTMINQLNDPRTNITTAEDPVEYQLHGITQVNVQQSIGFTFEVALRAFLRQDPDIILVGEIRDAETVGIAIKAALTGHLVFSTLHTNDAPSTVTRLFDMNVQPFLVAAAVRVIVAQRLARRVCADCKAEHEPTVDEKVMLEAMGYEDEQLSEMNFFQGTGCDKCHGIGYRGRVPIFEVMSLYSKPLREIITNKGNNLEIGKVAKADGMLSLGSHAMMIAQRGITTLEEAIKIGITE